MSLQGRVRSALVSFGDAPRPECIVYLGIEVIQRIRIVAAMSGYVPTIVWLALASYMIKVLA